MEHELAWFPKFAVAFFFLNGESPAIQRTSSQDCVSRRKKNRYRKRRADLSAIDIESAQWSFSCATPSSRIGDRVGAGSTFLTPSRSPRRRPGPGLRRPPPEGRFWLRCGRVSRSDVRRKRFTIEAKWCLTVSSPMISSKLRSMLDGVEWSTRLGVKERKLKFGCLTYRQQVGPVKNGRIE